MNLDSYIGQRHLLDNNGPIYKIMTSKKMYSLVLYGDPGIGKTTLANIIARELSLTTFNKNAATLKLEELKEIVSTINFSGSIILILDEIHRLDKRSQNYLLPYLETNKLYIIGTTTENPFFALNAALRSRLMLFNLKTISSEELLVGLNNINKIENPDKILDDEILQTIHSITSGDVRMSLNIMHFILENYELTEINAVLLRELFVPGFVYDKTDSNHYDLLSAFQKSIRASDVDAALHYLARLLKSGDYAAMLRRLIVIAYEDVGLGNPQACARAVTAVEAFERLGMPEGRIVLSHSVVELCLSPKSTSAYSALDLAFEDLDRFNLDSIPSYMLYNQPHKSDYDRNVVAHLDNLPKNLKGRSYFTSQDSSNYEKLLNEKYKARKKGVKK